MSNTLSGNASETLLVLVSAALWLGFLHTVTGPDHYLPFVVLKRARGWSWPWTILVTIMCGIGHVGSSILIAVIGIWAGYESGILQKLEEARGSWAAWGLFVFGLLYTVHGIWRGLRSKSHSHAHFHDSGMEHEHSHDHADDHTHAHGDLKTLTPWLIFIIFVLGPCEPMIPLLVFPAAKVGATGVAIIAAAFSLVTITTMVAMTLILAKGISLIPLRSMERFVHAFAGIAIAAAGAAMLFLGL
jgi:ABC-type nickel/cobalt efflux system permease component RcnA